MPSSGFQSDVEPWRAQIGAARRPLRQRRRTRRVRIRPGLAAPCFTSGTFHRSCTAGRRGRRAHQTKERGGESGEKCPDALSTLAQISRVAEACRWLLWSRWPAGGRALQMAPQDSRRGDQERGAAFDWADRPAQARRRGCCVSVSASRWRGRWRREWRE